MQILQQLCESFHFYLLAGLFCSQIRCWNWLESRNFYSIFKFKYPSNFICVSSFSAQENAKLMVQFTPKQWKKKERRNTSTSKKPSRAKPEKYIRLKKNFSISYSYFFFHCIIIFITFRGEERKSFSFFTSVFFFFFILWTKQQKKKRREGRKTLLI